jgi:hypothetical protein
MISGIAELEDFVRDIGDSYPDLPKGREFLVRQRAVALLNTDQAENE